MRSSSQLCVAGVCLVLAACVLRVYGDCPNLPNAGSGSESMTFGMGPTNTSVVEGRNVTFSCIGNGTVMWLINCQQTNSTQGASINVISDNSTLTLLSVGRGQDGTNITCVIGGEIVGSTALLTVMYVDVTLNLNKTGPYCPNEGIAISCNASGSPGTPNTTLESSGGTCRNGSSGTVSFPAEPGSNGCVYTCRASSGEANDASNVTINIISPVMVAINSSSSVVEEGMMFLLMCTTTSSVRMLSIQTANQTISESSNTTMLMANDSIHVDGEYVCVAVDSCGNVSNSTSVTVIPSAPINLSLSSSGSTWLFITWIHPSALNFTLKVNGAGFNCTYFTSSHTSFNITNLSPTTGYSITVIAVSGGRSSMSTMDLFSTSEDLPQPSPSSLPTPSPTPMPPLLTMIQIIGIAVGGGVVLLVMFVIIIILCCCCCCCRRRSGAGYSDIAENEPQKRSSSFTRSGSFRLSLRRPKAGDPVGDYRKANGTTHAMTAHPLIPVKGFVSRLSVMRMNDNQLFMEEFGSIPMQPLSARDTSQLAHNKEKNRYENILPYDHTRVKLSMIKWQQGSDYINANYLDGYMKHKAYIGTQGPIPATLGDFWRLVWEEDSRTIVMLTNTQEKGQTKCEAYWPSECDRPVSYGPVEVTMTEIVKLADYTIRTFSIVKGGVQKDARLVKQFHFTSWPDHGVPDFPTAMLSMVRCVRVHHNQWSGHGPMVVHCSAGVGRTGTFIVIDSCLQRMYSGEETLDIYGHVSLLRTQRNFMVQTEDQYFFIHEAVAEAVVCGVTEVKVDLFPQYLEQLEQFEGEDGDTTRIELEFRRLAIDRTEPHRFASATKEANKGKNRFINIMPYEYNRVKLNFMRGVDGSDYINASFIDSYRCQRAFLATQSPLPETMGDLWRMMWLQKSPVLVMLTRLVERRQVRCSEYWPEEGSVTYGNITVEHIVTRDSGTYVYREFKLSHSEFEETSHVVRQLHFLAWPEAGVPPSGANLLELLQEVQNLYVTLATDKPITVMCSSGVGRTAVFIALHIVLERMQIEGVIDIFQTVKILRIQRPAMVQTLELYQFCYNVLLDHLKQTRRVRTASSVSIDRKVSLRELTTSDSSPKLVNEPVDKTSTFGHTSSNGASQDKQLQTTVL